MGIVSFSTWVNLDVVREDSRVISNKRYERTARANGTDREWDEVLMWSAIYCNRGSWRVWLRTVVRWTTRSISIWRTTGLQPTNRWCRISVALVNFLWPPECFYRYLLFRNIVFLTLLLKKIHIKKECGLKLKSIFLKQSPLLYTLPLLYLSAFAPSYVYVMTSVFQQVFIDTLSLTCL